MEGKRFEGWKWREPKGFVWSDFALLDFRSSAEGFREKGVEECNLCNGRESPCYYGSWWAEGHGGWTRHLHRITGSCLDASTSYSLRVERAVIQSGEGRGGVPMRGLHGLRQLTLHNGVAPYATNGRWFAPTPISKLILHLLYKRFISEILKTT